MALILRYFTEFGNGPCLYYFTDFVYDVVLKQLLGLPRFQSLLLIVYDHINRVTAIVASTIVRSDSLQ